MKIRTSYKRDLPEQFVMTPGGHTMASSLPCAVQHELTPVSPIPYAVGYAIYIAYATR